MRAFQTGGMKGGGGQGDLNGGPGDGGRRPHQRSKAQKGTEGLGLPFHPWSLFTVLPAPPSPAPPRPPLGLPGREALPGLCPPSPAGYCRPMPQLSPQTLTGQSNQEMKLPLTPGQHPSLTLTIHKPPEPSGHQALCQGARLRVETQAMRPRPVKPT